MKAIDSHIHFSTRKGYLIADQAMRDAMEKYYRMKVVFKTEEEMAQDFISMDVKAVLLPVDAEVSRGWPFVGNDYAAGLVKQFPQAFIGSFAGVDPWKGEMAIKEVRRAVKELGMIGVKFQQAIQEFFPDDHRFYPLWEEIASLGVPIVLHCGTTGAGAGMPGGGGFRLKFTRPIPHMDDLACDFPNLTIIMAHPGWPWVEEQIAVLLHKPNVFLDLSGWAPRYFPESLKREINGRLQDKVLYGSDYPEISPKRWLEEFEQGGYKSEVVEKVLLKNAQRVLKLKV